MKINNLELKTLYENYLNHINAITTLYAVVAFTDQQLNDKNSLQLSKVTIPLSTDFDDGFTTIKNEKDIFSCSISGKLHQINCYQTVISLVSNFENLINSLIKMLSITDSLRKDCSASSYGNEIPNPTLKKLVAIHELRNIESNMTGSHELQYFYKIILLRNNIIHRQGKLKKPDKKLEMWTNKNSNVIEFNQNNIDDFIHFFLLPMQSFISSIDCYLENEAYQI